MQIIQDPVCDRFWSFGGAGCFFEVAGQVEIVGEDAGIVGGNFVLPDKARALLLRQLRQAGSHIRKQHFGFHRHQIGVGKIAIIMRAFLGAHKKGLASNIIPPPRFLLQLFAASKRFDLPRYFVGERAADPAD